MVLVFQLYQPLKELCQTKRLSECDWRAGNRSYVVVGVLDHDEGGDLVEYLALQRQLVAGLLLSLDEIGDISRAQGQARVLGIADIDAQPAEFAVGVAHA